jgi:hypothetical protein
MNVKDIPEVTLQAVIDRILATSEKDMKSDDTEFNAYDYSGGNFDDAFQSGMRDGEILFAGMLASMIRKQHEDE